MANNNAKYVKYGKGRVNAGCALSAVCNRKNSAALSQITHTTETVILVKTLSPVGSVARVVYVRF